MDKYLSKEERRKMNTFNRSNGRTKQMRAKELLGVPDRKFGGKSADEEHWNSEVRFEVNRAAKYSLEYILNKSGDTLKQVFK